MTAVSRALILFVPLVLFALGGALYTPSPSSTSTTEESDISLAPLPPLPKWAQAPLPDFSEYRDVTERKVAFFSFLYPRIVLANSRILIEREYLEQLAEKDTLSTGEQTWLSDQAQRLRVDGEPGSQAQFDGLRKHLDVIPPSLILAQAANESAWGQSRFAVRGNNLFGQWCFTKGCGLVPQSRPEGSSHEVATFSSPYFSVRSYIQNLNRHAAYQQVRDVREQDRQNNRALSGVRLAAGLISYSERGEDYIEEIRSMIRFNNLEFYDQEFRDLLQKRTPSRFVELASARAESSLLPSGEDGAATPFEG